MFKKAKLPLLILLGLATFVCTIVAIKRDEFHADNTPRKESSVFVPQKFQAKNNDTLAIAQEAQNGNAGNFVNVEDPTSTGRSGVFYNVYKFLAIVGYALLAGLIMYRGRF